MNTPSLRSSGLLIACIAVPLFAGLIGSIATIPAISSWYTILIKPPLTPPNWVFGPVWTTLYILMGISLYLVVSKGTENKLVRLGMLLFAAQLIVNILWSFVFFGLHSPILGLAIILILIILVLAMIYCYYQVSRIAAGLQVPYIVWLCIATYLNIMILVLN